MRVRYNGGLNCNLLTKGCIYTLASEAVFNWHTEYTLYGVPGEFDSIYFEKIDKEISMDGFGTSIPKSIRTRSIPVISQPIIGHIVSMKCDCVTTPVEKITTISERRWICKTANSTYIVELT